MIDSLRLAQSLNTENQFQDNFYYGLNKKAIGNYNEAIKAFHSCLELIPENPTVLFLIGDLYLKDKSYELAEKNLKKSISLDPNNFWFKVLWSRHVISFTLSCYWPLVWGKQRKGNFYFCP